MELLTIIVVSLAAMIIEEITNFVRNRKKFGNMLPTPDYHIKEYNPDKYDAELRDKCVDLLNKRFDRPKGEKLYRRIELKMEGMNIEEKKRLMHSIIGDTCQAMGISIDKVEFKESPMYGSYNFSSNTMMISTSYLKDSDNSAECVKTIFHELKHAVQFNAVSAGASNKWGYPEELLIDWANNFQNYIPAQQDPEMYLNQPLEMDAFGFESSVIPIGAQATH